MTDVESLILSGILLALMVWAIRIGSQEIPLK